VYLQVVACLYLAMVVVMVGMNYKLKERKQRGVPMGEGEEKKVIKSSSVSFTEGRGVFSTLVSASTRCGKRNLDV
jgi:hypothetical protein